MRRYLCEKGKLSISNGGGGRRSRWDLGLVGRFGSAGAGGGKGKGVSLKWPEVV